MNKTPQIEIIWKKIFNVEKIEVNKTFFEQGGGSLQALLFINEVNNEFNTDFNVIDLFENPTIGLFLEYFKQNHSNTESHNNIEDINSVTLKKILSHDNTYETSYSQKAHFIRYKYSSNWIPENITLYFDFDYYNEDSLKLFINYLLQRHESLNTSYLYKNGEVYQKINPFASENIHFSFIDIIVNENKSAELQSIYLKELNKKFDIETGPIFSISICRVEENLWRLYFTVDMSVSEGTSSIILKNEIPIIYNSFHLHSTLNLTPIPIQYKDFCEWEKILLLSDKGQKMKAYWKNYFSLSPPAVLLTPDFPYPAKKKKSLSYKESLQDEVILYCKPSAIDEINHISGIRSSFRFYPGAMGRIILGKDKIDSLSKIANELNTTKYILCLTSMYLLIYKISKENKIVIGNCISVRDDKDLSNTIGFFTNIIFTNVSIDENESFKQLVSKVNKHFFDGYQNKNYPWERILEENSISYDSISTLFLDWVKIPDSFKGNIETPSHIEGVPCVFDNNCIINEYDDNLVFNWIYPKDFFKAKTFTNIMNKHYHIINTIIDNQDFIINDIKQSPFETSLNTTTS